MRLLYFGWVRQRIGTGGETMPLPAGVADVAALIAHLAAKGDTYAAAFADTTALRVAVNQEMAALDTQIADSDEVALFPPMTGGCGGGAASIGLQRRCEEAARPTKQSRANWIAALPVVARNDDGGAGAEPDREHPARPPRSRAR